MNRWCTVLPPPESSTVHEARERQGVEQRFKEHHAAFAVEAKSLQAARGWNLPLENPLNHEFSMQNDCEATAISEFFVPTCCFGRGTRIIFEATCTDSLHRYALDTVHMFIDFPNTGTLPFWVVHRFWYPTLRNFVLRTKDCWESTGINGNHHFLLDWLDCWWLVHLETTRDIRWAWALQGAGFPSLVTRGGCQRYFSQQFEPSVGWFVGWQC